MQAPPSLPCSPAPTFGINLGGLKVLEVAPRRPRRTARIWKKSSDWQRTSFRRHFLHAAIIACMPPSSKTLMSLLFSQRVNFLGISSLLTQALHCLLCHITGAQTLLGTLFPGALGAGVKRVISPIARSCSGRKRGLSCGRSGILPRALCSPEAKPVGRGPGRRCFLPTLENYTECRFARADAPLLAETTLPP